LLGLHKDSRGSTNNNIVFAGTAFAKKTRVVGGTVMKDPKASPEERYRFVWLALGAHSPDGLHWTRYPKSLFLGVAADTHPVVFHDDRIGRYVTYSRHNVWQTCPAEESRQYAQAVRVQDDQILRRRVMRSESDDGVNWDSFQPVLVPGDHPAQRTYDFYNSGALKYPWAARAYFLRTSRYHYASNSLDVQLAVSRDGIHWTRPTERPFLALGKEREFDARGILSVAESCDTRTGFRSTTPVKTWAMDSRTCGPCDRADAATASAEPCFAWTDSPQWTPDRVKAHWKLHRSFSTVTAWS